MFFIEILKAIAQGIVQGITEWLPVSSTGHILLLDAVWKMQASEAFFDVFKVIIQLGSILAVVMLYFRKLNPFSGRKGRPKMWAEGNGVCRPSSKRSGLWIMGSSSFCT